MSELLWLGGRHGVTRKRRRKDEKHRGKLGKNMKIKSAY